jgi:hypothetical protein
MNPIQKQGIDFSDYAGKTKTNAVLPPNFGQNDKKNKMQIIVITICIVLILFFLGYYFYQNNQNNANSLDASGQFIPE